LPKSVDWANKIDPLSSDFEEILKDLHKTPQEYNQAMSAIKRKNQHPNYALYFEQNMKRKSVRISKQSETMRNSTLEQQSSANKKSTLSSASKNMKDSKAPVISIPAVLNKEINLDDLPLSASSIFSKK
jgi:hypothetical protein